EAAAIKHIVSPVAGRANVLVVPDLEAGNMLAKSLSFLARAAAAGIVLGARVPIILTSRADSVITPRASRAVASLAADARRKGPAAAIRGAKARICRNQPRGRRTLPSSTERRRWSSVLLMIDRSPGVAPSRCIGWALRSQ